MIVGTHLLFYSEQPEADRAFLRDVLGFKSVDAGHGWLIFALPPTEAAVHPAEKNASETHADNSHLRAEIYLMCEDLKAEMKRLAEKKVEFSEIEQARWGSKTTLLLPSGARLGLYQPRHPVAINL